MIKENGWQNIFKVPHKWIYALPEFPKSPEHYLQKNFILVEEDMDLCPHEENKIAWSSSKVDKHILRNLFILIDEIGLLDCTKIHNIPFSNDGRIAFIDTQTYHKWPIDYSYLTSYLSPDMKPYWKKITNKGRTE